MSELTVDELLAELPGIIDAHVRAALARQPATQGIMVHTGTVESSDGTTATVQLDADPALTPVTVQLATPADISDRVLVFTTAPGGAYAIGNGAAQAIAPQALGIAISALPSAVVPLTGAEKVPMDQAGVTVEATTMDIADLGGGSGFPVGPTDDGIATHEIYIPIPGALFARSTSDADPNYIAGLVNGAVATALVSSLEVNDNAGQLGVVGADLSGTAHFVKALIQTAGYGGSATVQCRSTNGGPQFIEVGQGDEHVSICAGSGGTTLGFFGVSTVPQQATPVTLADVIALLQAYGLCP